MKMFTEPKEQPKKSWSIKMEQSINDSIAISAVDSITGEHIGVVLRFNMDGRVYSVEALVECLEDMGYNPYEHNNRFDEQGAIEIFKR